MKKMKLQQIAQLITSIGLILVVAPMLLSSYMNFPDFPKGIILGIGLGMELIGAVTLIRLKRKNKCHL